jgi:predicted metal-dependent hydrolase
MRRPEVIHDSTPHILRLDGNELEWWIVRSAAAKQLRIKVSPEGVQVVVPDSRDPAEAREFILRNRVWVTEQLKRARQLRAVRRPEKRMSGRIHFRGESLPINVISCPTWRAPNKVQYVAGTITITRGPNATTTASRSLEYWLRKQARAVIAEHIVAVRERVKRRPRRIYVMSQRTKWGNCSALGNLSFNWRLIMAPDYVLRYIVTHEMVHLAIPDHSQRFWLTVKSFCPSADRARQWLVANGHRLTVPLDDVLAPRRNSRADRPCGSE